MIKIKPVQKPPKGAPFWRWYINLGVGECEIKCKFCFNKRWNWSTQEWRCHACGNTTIKNFEAFRWEAGKCKQYEGLHDIMMSSVGDAFAPMNRDLTAYILLLSSQNPHVGDHLRVCSKGDGSQEVGIASTNTMFGATICTMDEKIRQEIMPNAAKLNDALGSYLYAANSRGNPIFISTEPMLRDMNLCKLMEEMYEHDVENLTEMWVGHLNYGHGCEDYAMSDEEIIRQVRELLDSYDVRVYLKRDVKGSAQLREEGLVIQEGFIYDSKVASEIS